MTACRREWGSKTRLTSPETNGKRSQPPERRRVRQLPFGWGMLGAETLAKVQILNNKTMNPPKKPHQNCCFASSQICRFSTFLFTRPVSRLARTTCTSKTPRHSNNLRRWQPEPTLTRVPLHSLFCHFWQHLSVSVPFREEGAVKA